MGDVLACPRTTIVRDHVRLGDRRQHEPKPSQDRRFLTGLFVRYRRVPLLPITDSTHSCSLN